MNEKRRKFGEHVTGPLAESLAQREKPRASCCRRRVAIRIP
jgi:hypothetical protein